MYDMQREHNLGTGGEGVSLREIAKLSAEGFSEQEVEHLNWARYRYQRGTLNEWAEDYKQLMFARWLYERGKIRA